jgi:hypothetical protein
MKKIYSLLLVMALVLCSMPGTFAATDPVAYPNVTFADSSDFTIVRSNNTPESIKAMGLNSSWKKVSFTNAEIPYLTWKTSDPSVIQFDYWWIFGAATISGRDQVSLKTKGDGEATITLTYNPPNGSPVTVKSFVVVEGGQTISSISSITTNFDGKTMNDFTKKGSVPLFSLKDIYGQGFNDNDVLKKSPSALHALLYNLELKNGNHPSVTSISAAGWNWDWVKKNVIIESEGSYVKKIGTDVNSYSEGWQYKINNQKIDHASSASKLNIGNSINWTYEAFAW